MRKVIGIFGLPGVGKSHLSQKVCNERGGFTCVKASEIIERFKGAVALGDLTEDSVEMNQEKLIKGFGLYRLMHEKTDIIIELHNVIETKKGMVDVEFSVFERLNLDLAVFLSADPSFLLSNRRSDKSRDRLIVSEYELGVRQKYAMKRFEECFSKIRVPHVIIEPDFYSNFLSLLDGDQ